MWQVFGGDRAQLAGLEICERLLQLFLRVHLDAPSTSRVHGLELLHPGHGTILGRVGISTPKIAERSITPFKRRLEAFFLNPPAPL